MSCCLHTKPGLTLFVVVWLSIWSTAVAAQSRDYTRDNIVFILVDDLGYADMSPERMPKLNVLLRRKGTQFPNFIVHQNCTPSRTAFLTGNDPSRINMYSNLPVPIRTGIPPRKELISERLQLLGYSTCHVGKWGVGSEYEESPIENGFQDSLESYRINNVQYKTNRFQDIYQTDAAIKFLQKAEEPFFLYAPFESPHSPYRAPRETFDRIKPEFGITAAEESAYLEELYGIVHIKAGPIAKESKLRIQQALYYSMVSVLDDQVLRLYETLEARGTADHTLFMFVSDNGGITPIASNGNLRGRKASIYDGGHRAANGIIWPGVVKPRMIVNSNIWIGDMFATFSDVAGEENPGIGSDGGSILPAIKRNIQVLRGQNNDSTRVIAHVGKKRRPHDSHLIHGEFAVWDKGFKYLRFVDFDLDGKVQELQEELYNLKRDPNETTNLIDRKGHASLIEKLQGEFSSWGGTRRLWRLRTEDHTVSEENWITPENWFKRRPSFQSDIWP